MIARIFSPSTRTAICAALFFISTSGNAAVFQSGEELQYKVTYGFFRLGTLIVRTLPDSADPGRFHIVIIARSASGIPFINVREYHESIISAATQMSQCFYGKYETNNERNIVRASYDAGSATITYQRTDATSGAMLQQDTLRNAVPCVDGPSLLSFARAHSTCGSILRVPTLVGGALSSTTLDFTPPVEFVSIDAVDVPIRAHRFEGRADWTYSTDGLTGAFTGWVSDDDAAIPVMAKLKIIVGSVTLELEKWTRNGWVPPSETLTSR